MNKEKIIQAGKIAKQVKEFAKTIIKKDVPLLKIAEEIENKIISLGGKLAFPVNLCINEIAAHCTPSYNDETLASGLLKVDIGIHVDGWIADTAFSLDLEDNEKNKELIKASKSALKKSIEIINSKTSLKDIGEIIERTIKSYGFFPIVNLTGHSIDKYELHSDMQIPNIKVNRDIPIENGLRAIEPFATFGVGKVHDGKPSGIYVLTDDKNPRSPLARKILEFIADEYKTLPFCSRWIVKKFGVSSLFALRELEQNNNIHHYAQLIESSKEKVSQAEESIFIEGDDVIVLT
jgi:methionyl aminopeptidase